MLLFLWHPFVQQLPDIKLVLYLFARETEVLESRETHSLERIERSMH